MARLTQIAEAEDEDAVFELNFDGEWFTVAGTETSHLRVRPHKESPMADLVSKNDLLVAKSLTREDWATLFRVSSEMLQRLGKV